MAIFHAGASDAAINIMINDDNIFENNENFTLTINSSSLPSYITVINPSEVTVTILDDDRKIVYDICV